MKVLQIALIAALLCAPGGHALAEANAAKYSGTSSFKSGFSSQKNNSSKNNSPKAAPGKNNSSFGSFGARQRDAAAAPASPATPAPAADAGSQAAKRGGFGAFGSGAASAPPSAPGQSAMGKDLAQSQAQAQALKTLDERRAAANAPAPLPPLDNRVPGAGQSAPPPPNYGPQPYNQPPVVLQQSGGNGMGAAILGFMLGRATASHASGNQGYYPANAVPGNPGAGAVPQPGQHPPASFGGTVLRIFAWLLVLGVIGWLIYFALRFFKRGTARGNANYSFERE